MPYKDPDVRRHKQKAYAAAYYQKTKEETKKRSKKKRLRMREEWHAFKATLYCTKCGFNHSAALDFHHIDGMYSYCTDSTGKVHHIAAWADVEVLGPDEEPNEGTNIPKGESNE